MGNGPTRRDSNPRFCGVGINDPKGKSWYAYDWGSSDGVRERDPVYPIGDGEKQKAKNCPKEGAHDGTRTHVGMSKRLDLIT
jgi:hypothetical protein